METPNQGFIGEDDDYDVTEEEAQTEEENLGTIGISPYLGWSRRFLDTKYDIRKDGEQLMMGDSPVFVDTRDNFTIKGTVFRGTEVCGNC